MQSHVQRWLRPSGRDGAARARAAWRRLAALAVGLWACCGSAGADDDRLVVGSKRFTESYILAEIVAQAAGRDARVEHRQGLGNTAVVFEALKAGAIDVYPEYLGTLDAEILKNRSPTSLDAMRAQLARWGLGVAVPLGFANGYALAMRGQDAQRLGLRTLSGLKAHPALAVGLSHEFLGRQDGWPGLAARYRLPQRPLGIDHGVAYAALASGRIAVTDIYTTDAKIAQLQLAVLEDDLGFFPRYDAVLLYRLDVTRRFPAAWRAITALEGRVDTAAMIAMNGEAELQGRPFADIARDFLADRPPPAAAAPRNRWLDRLLGDDLGRLTAQHLMLVAVAVAAATLIGVPLGAAAAAVPRLEAPLMALVGVLQTVPSLALFAVLIPLMGRIGTVPALVALGLYALLPIVRNTAAGLGQVRLGLREAGLALGLTRLQRWRHVDLPLAAPVILAGIKTAAVITVGTATIAAFIGAGGFGERIVTGLALNDHAALLSGAVPAALLALLVQGVFEGIERWVCRHQQPASPPRRGAGGSARAKPTGPAPSA
ncbi:glycine betaine ABC transporter substrate-binding protein [Caldimonas brevitalea]|uniref:Osmoprotectant transport system substrate-binding protein n=1 Tax=Caldimonas brevitalea TaxID=413882 RepID=A0A0G3BHI9_9BURK|nr:glycine betaine ABC transporter substrate-binding protein [Caldimonas brevitalea]AKJ27458.1 osmoprotectant transport system substrate-binding protein [Caldimonas brevitalea]